MGYWGYPWANGSGYGYPWAGAGYSYPTAGGGSHASSGADHGAASHDSGHGDSSGGHGEKTGGITGFFKGIAQGAVNTIKGIFTPQGLLMLGGTAALTVLTGGAILPLLGAVGIGIGGYQMIKGAASGDTEKMGEGAFSLGLSTLGFMGPKAVTVKGTQYALTPPNSGIGSNLWARLKAPFGLSKYRQWKPDGTAVDGVAGQNMYQLSWAKAKSNFETLQQKWNKKQPTGTQTELHQSSTSGSRTSSNGHDTVELQSPSPKPNPDPMGLAELGRQPVKAQVTGWKAIKAKKGDFDPPTLEQLRIDVAKRLQEPDLATVKMPKKPHRFRNEGQTHYQARVAKYQERLDRYHLKTELENFDT